jgi:hypothetical protein
VLRYQVKERKYEELPKNLITYRVLHALKSNLVAILSHKTSTRAHSLSASAPCSDIACKESDKEAAFVTLLTLITLLHRSMPLAFAMSTIKLLLVDFRVLHTKSEETSEHDTEGMYRLDELTPLVC